MLHKPIGSVWKFKYRDNSLWKVIEHKGLGTNLCICIQGGTFYKAGDQRRFFIREGAWKLVPMSKETPFTDEEYERLLV